LSLRFSKPADLINYTFLVYQRAENNTNIRQEVIFILRGKLNGGTIVIGFPVGIAAALGGGCDVSVAAAIASGNGMNGCTIWDIIC